MMLLHMMLEVLLRGVHSDCLQQDCPEDDESSAQPVVPKDGFVQVQMCEEHSNDDPQVPEERDGEDWQAINRLVEREDVEEARNEAETEEGGEKDEWEMRDVCDERVFQERT